MSTTLNNIIILYTLIKLYIDLIKAIIYIRNYKSNNKRKISNFIIKLSKILRLRPSPYRDLIKSMDNIAKGKVVYPVNKFRKGTLLYAMNKINIEEQSYRG